MKFKDLKPGDKFMLSQSPRNNTPILIMIELLIIKLKPEKSSRFNAVYFHGGSQIIIKDRQEVYKMSADL